MVTNKKILNIID